MQVQRQAWSTMRHVVVNLRNARVVNSIAKAYSCVLHATLALALLFAIPSPRSEAQIFNCLATDDYLFRWSGVVRTDLQGIIAHGAPGGEVALFGRRAGAAEVAALLKPYLSPGNDPLVLLVCDGALDRCPWHETGLIRHRSLGSQVASLTGREVFAGAGYVYLENLSVESRSYGKDYCADIGWRLFSPDGSFRDVPSSVLRARFEPRIYDVNARAWVPYPELPYPPETLPPGTRNQWPFPPSDWITTGRRPAGACFKMYTDPQGQRKYFSIRGEVFDRLPGPKSGRTTLGCYAQLAPVVTELGQHAQVDPLHALSVAEVVTTAPGLMLEAYGGRSVQMGLATDSSDLLGAGALMQWSGRTLMGQRPSLSDPGLPTLDGMMAAVLPGDPLASEASSVLLRDAAMLSALHGQPTEAALTERMGYHPGWCDRCCGPACPNAYVPGFFGRVFGWTASEGSPYDRRR